MSILFELSKKLAVLTYLDVLIHLKFVGGRVPREATWHLAQQAASSYPIYYLTLSKVCYPFLGLMSILTYNVWISMAYKKPLLPHKRTFALTPSLNNVHTSILERHNDTNLKKVYPFQIVKSWIITANYFKAHAYQEVLVMALQTLTLLLMIRNSSGLWSVLIPTCWLMKALKQHRQLLTGIQLLYSH